MICMPVSTHQKQHHQKQHHHKTHKNTREVAVVPCHFVVVPCCGWSANDRRFLPTSLVAAHKIPLWLQIRRFVRYNLGEGIEKKSQDFAAEVAAQTGK